MRTLIILRKANQEDISKFYKYLHRDFIKKYSTLDEKEEWKNHRRTYKFLINSPNYLLYIIEDEQGRFLGQLKFELEGEIAIVSIYLVNEVRGQGYARNILLNGLEELIHESDEVRIVLAYILEENESSIKVFESIGFVYENDKEHGGLDHKLYTRAVRP